MSRLNLGKGAIGLGILLVLGGGALACAARQPSPVTYYSWSAPDYTITQVETCRNKDAGTDR